MTWQASLSQAPVTSSHPRLNAKGVLQLACFLVIPHGTLPLSLPPHSHCVSEAAGFAAHCSRIVKSPLEHLFGQKAVGACIQLHSSSSGVHKWIVCCFPAGNLVAYAVSVNIDVSQQGLFPQGCSVELES